MSIVILNGFQSENLIENVLKALLEEKGKEIFRFKLSDMNILPCRSCGSCGHRTPGECILKDDMHRVMRAIAKSDVMVMLTPIRYGGYSSDLKKAMDRTMSMGLPLYIVKEGHLLHPMRYGEKFILAIGLDERNKESEKKNFKTLVARNGLNMQSSHRTLIFDKSNVMTNREYEIKNVLMEVLPE